MLTDNIYFLIKFSQEFTAGLGEGENKLKSTVDLAARTAKNTSPQGQDTLRREVDHLKREWEDYRYVIIDIIVGSKCEHIEILLLK